MRERSLVAFYVFRFYATILAVIIAGVAWILRLGGLSWEQWRPLEYLCMAPLAVLALLYMPEAVRKAKKMGRFSG